MSPMIFDEMDPKYKSAKNNRRLRKMEYIINNPAYLYSYITEKSLLHKGKKGRKNDRRH